MTAQTTLFDALAELYIYPDEGFAEVVTRVQGLVEDRWPGHGDSLTSLLEKAQTMSRGEVEEMFTQNFDFNPATALEVGWHIYGEDYARGALLVRLRAVLRTSGVAEDVELPDHLTYMLRLVSRLESAIADDLVGRYLLTALDKIKAGIGDASPYAPLITLTRELLTLEHPEAVVMPVPNRSKKEPPDSKNRLPVIHHPLTRGGGHRQKGPGKAGLEATDGN